MERYVIYKPTERQLNILWYGLYTLRDYVKDSPHRQELFGTIEEIDAMMNSLMLTEVKHDDSETTS